MSKISGVAGVNVLYRVVVLLDAILWVIACCFSCLWCVCWHMSKIVTVTLVPQQTFLAFYKKQDHKVFGLKPMSSMEKNAPKRPYTYLKIPHYYHYEYSTKYTPLLGSQFSTFILIKQN